MGICQNSNQKLNVLSAQPTFVPKLKVAYRVLNGNRVEKHQVVVAHSHYIDAKCVEVPSDVIFALFPACIYKVNLAKFENKQLFHKLLPVRFTPCIEA